MSGGAADRKPVDKWIPWMFVLFFGTIAAVDGVMVTLAVRTQTGVVTEHPYEEGLAYNKVIEAAQAQDNLGWKSSIAVKGGNLSFTLSDGEGRPLSGATAYARIVRPVQDGYDFDVPLTETGKGVYGAAVRFPLKGEWDVRIYATWQDKHYQSNRILLAD